MIQKFAFELSSPLGPICQGESMFGYFTTQMMENQVGMDGGAAVLPWVRTPAGEGQQGYVINASNQPAADKPHFHLSVGQMNLLDDIFVLPGGGIHGQGYVYSSRMVNAQDWFYSCHFHEDPVMPGSLGIEAILQALQGYAVVTDLVSAYRSPRFDSAAGIPPMTWRYRGQITPKNRFMEVETHITGIQHGPNTTTLLADANLWVDGLRIYEVKSAAVSIVEA